MAIFRTEDELKIHLKKFLKDIGHFQPIETGATASGVPDLNYCFEGIEVWIELKIIHGNKMKFRPTQVPWHIRRARFGGSNYILAADCKESLWLWEGQYIRELFDHGIKAAVPHRKVRQDDVLTLLEIFRQSHRDRFQYSLPGPVLHQKETLDTDKLSS